MSRKATHAPSGHWSGVTGAHNHVIRLLQDSGALLETQAAEACSRFVRATHQKKGISVSTESVTYGRDTEESPLRQIDQRVQMYKEFILDERTGVQSILSIPVEVKYRKDVEVFGINYPQKSYRPRMPTTGFFHGSQLSKTLLWTLLDEIVLAQPIFLDITNGTIPRKVHEDNVAYNAAGALYDFIRFELQREEEVTSYEGKIISDMRLLQRFEKYLGKKHYAWWSVIYAWIKENLTNVLAEEFNRRVGGGRVYYGLNVHVPVLIVNGPVWRYKPPAIEPCGALLTRVRVPRWPGTLRQFLIRYTAEAPLVITNTDGLPRVLRLCMKWFRDTENTMKQADKQMLARWPIEAAFYRAVLAKHSQNEPGDRLQSDLDVFDWL
jgi:hypothetical protein